MLVYLNTVVTFFFTLLTAAAATSLPESHSPDSHSLRHETRSTLGVRALAARTHHFAGEAPIKAHGKRETNASRFAKGFAPLPPRRLNGVRSTRVRNGLQPRASAHTVILVYDANGKAGTHLGFVSGHLNGYGDYYLTTSCADAWVNPEFVSNGLVNSAQPGGYPNAGFVTNEYDTFRTATVLGGFAWMDSQRATTPGAPPTISTERSDNIGTHLESNIWSIGPDNELIPTWINPDSQPAPTELTYIPQYDDGFLICGSLAYMSIRFSTPTLKRIRFFLQDAYVC